MHEAQLAQCIQVSETFLKLGYLADAKKALNLAMKRQRNEEVEENAKRVESLEKLQQKVDDFCGCMDNENARSLLNNAIDVLKELESMAVRWRTSGSSGVPAAAACCVLVQDWAEQIINVGTGLSEGRKRMLQMISNSSRTHLKELRSLNGVTFSSIDRYQGSENDVVIISLVRSNAECKVGFLQEPARRVVAQSRARLGMYVVGDGKTFEKSPHWSRLTANLEGRGRRGTGIPLCCPAHKSCVREISWKEASSVIECGVCQQPCGQLMSCGIHVCKRRCHGTGGGGIDKLHMICHEKVQDVCCGAEKHAITRKCYQQPADVSCRACEELERKRKEKEKRDAEAREQQTRIELEMQIEELKKAPAGLVSTELRRDSKEDVAEYLAVMDRTEKYVQADHDNPIQVLRIEKLYHPRLEQRFHEAKLQLNSSLRDCVTRDLFHGSSDEGVSGITENGFRLPKWSPNNMFGQGVYFATDSSKSARELYTKGSNKLILCDVLLGKPCTVERLESSHPLSKHVKTNDTVSPSRPYLDVNLAKVRKAGFDSVFAPRGGSMEKSGVKYDEMIVYDTDQALPKYIIHFGKYAHAVATPSLSGDSFHIREVKPTRTFNPDDQAQMHLRICEAHLTRQAPNKKLLKIELVVNPALMRQFEEQRSDFQSKRIPTETVLAFHATRDRSTVEKIVRDNFDLAFIGSQTDAGWYGRGFYFSEFPAVSQGYGSNMLLCKVLPGKTFDLTVTDRMDGQRLKQGFNSHRVAGDANGYGQELMIDNPRQILPCYILHVQ